MRRKSSWMSFVWASLFLSLGSFESQAMMCVQELVLEELPSDLIREIQQFLPVSDYSAASLLNREWRALLKDSYTYQAHHALDVLMRSSFAGRGSVYEQIKFLEQLDALLGSLAGRVVSAGKSDVFFRSLRSRVEIKKVALALKDFRGPWRLVSPVLRVAQGQALGPVGQDQVFDLANLEGAVNRDRILLALSLNPSLHSGVWVKLWELLEREVALSGALPHWGGYWLDDLRERLIRHPSEPAEFQMRRFAQLEALQFFPSRVGRVIAWVEKSPVAPEVQQEIFGVIIPQVLALPREAHLPYLARLLVVLAKNRTLTDENRDRLLKLALEVDLSPLEQAEVLIALASNIQSEVLQFRIWNEISGRFGGEFLIQLVQKFAENQKLSAEIQRKIAEAVLRLPLSESLSLRFRMAQHPQLCGQVVAFLAERNRSHAAGGGGEFQLRSGVQRVDVLFALELAKNPKLSTKEIEFLVAFSQSMTDEADQKSLVKQILNQPNLSPKLLDQLETIFVLPRENPYPPEWYQLRRLLFRSLPKG